MITLLELKNLGPAPRMELFFGSRLNLLTGDNGLGKSFLLDIAWWAMTRKWPAEVNARLSSGQMARPSLSGDASIKFSFTAKVVQETYTSSFLRSEQTWRGRPGRPANPGLVIYAMADGSFGIWDPHRNYWLNKDGQEIQDRPPAYVFSQGEVWDGQQDDARNWRCNGLIRDWSSWKSQSGDAFGHLCKVLEVLSPSAKEPLVPGELTRISLDDVRDMPTIRMPYGQEVPVVFASAGVKRILGLAYILVWAWEEHRRAALLRGGPETHQITFLVDEIEAHLHPSWQRRIIPALLTVMESLNPLATVQLITSTHSPLAMVSVEQLFDSERDAWFDLDLVDGQAQLSKQTFAKRGSADRWLTSSAFDLASARSIEGEALVAEAASLLDKKKPGRKEINRMYQALVSTLDVKDDFLFRWRAICQSKGWLA